MNLIHGKCLNKCFKKKNYVNKNKVMTCSNTFSINTIYHLLAYAAFRFNYRATAYMVKNGFYNFLNWFDETAW